MKPPRNVKFDSTWLVAILLAVLLPLLAVLQFVWLTQLSHLGQERLQSLLQTGADRFAEEFDESIQPAYRTFELLLNTQDTRHLESQLAVAYVRVLEKSKLAESLLGRVLWVVPRSDGGLEVQEFLPRESRLREIHWPEELEALQRFLTESSAPPLPARSEIPFYLLGGVPVVLVPHDAPVPRDSAYRQRPAWIVLVLDRDFLVGSYLPALSVKYFSGDHGLRVDVAVRSASPPHAFLFRSNPVPAGDEFAVADAAANLFRLRDQLLMVVSQPLPEAGVPAATEDRLQAAGTASGSGVRRAESSDAHPPDPAGRWQLLVRHPVGSLEAAMLAVHRRNLLISFGILVLLAGAVVLLFVSVRRARSLARLQVEFVRGISHELRTPLAVISAAGANLADAVVRDPERTRRYGEVIRREGRRLGTLVEQVTRFSRIRSGRSPYDLHPLSVAGVIASAMERYQAQLDEGSFEVTVEIPHDLPEVLGDEQALTSVVENLISNAIKYSRDERSLRITAMPEHAAAGTMVRIEVEDRGMGIAAADQKLIFEPFRRGQDTQVGQIEGSGLGLSLVREIVEAHGGSVEVRSVRGAGSKFTLRLPVSRSPTAASPPEANAPRRKEGHET